MAKLAGKFSGAEGRKSAAAAGKGQNLQMKSPFHFRPLGSLLRYKQSWHISVFIAGNVAVESFLTDF